jgi:pimeloyl-ACP methyl ester carboxylesterase
VQSFDAGWEIEPIERFYRRLASFSRLILFDKRGTGLSDRVAPDDLPTLEIRMDDMRAVMDKVGVRRAVSTVKDLVAGSGLEFEDRGSHELKGVPGKWRLYAVSNA